jgi:hypothetical protein
VLVPSDSLTTITTDTGDLAPGNKAFARFTTPGMCVGAVQVFTQLDRNTTAARVTHALQEYAVVQDSAAASTSLPAAAVDVARQCGARFTMANVAAVDLPALFTLALMEGRDSLAHAIVERRRMLAKDVASQAQVLVDAVGGYLDAEPVRVSMAESAVAQIDALGSAAPVHALNAHDMVLSYASSRFDVLRMRREAERLIAIGHDAPMSSIQYAWEPILHAYIALGTLAYVNAPDSVMTVMLRAKQDLQRFPPAIRWPPGHAYHTEILNLPFKTVSVEKVRDELLPFNTSRHAGKRLPPVSATYWFPKTPNRWPPGHGVPSLVIYGSGVRACAGILRPFFFGCFDLYEYLPYLFKQYGNKLAVTLVTQTDYSAMRSSTLTPAQQADSLRWFYLEHLKFPITLGIVEDSTKVLPGFDGRQLLRDTSFYGNLAKPALWRVGNQSAVIALYDAHGELRYLDFATDFSAPELRVLIARLVRESSPSASQSSASPRTTP